MNKSILAGAAFLATAATAVPMLAWSAEPPIALSAQPATQPDRAAPLGMEHRHGRDMAMRSPQQRCEGRIAHRAARVAYVVSMLNLTQEQRSLYAKVEAAMQGNADKQHQLCASLPTDASAEPTVLDRMNRQEQFLQARLAGMQQVQPALQALYQALTPAQKAIIDHPFHRG